MDRIFYFSSTGNSLYIAKRIGERFGASPAYIPKVKERAIEADRITVVSPIYSFGLPVHVYDFLTELKTKAKLYVVLNYGGTVSGADRLTYDLCAAHGLDVRAVFTVKMVENFTLDFTVPKFYGAMTLKKAPARIDAVIDRIERGEAFSPKTKTDKRAVYEKNKSNWFEIGRRFTVSDDCVLCGKCVAVCPAGNISVQAGKIVFGEKCVACLGCYHRCPKKAIRYRNRHKKDRYICPLIDEAEIGKA